MQRLFKPIKKLLHSKDKKPTYVPYVPTTEDKLEKLLQSLRTCMSILFTYENESYQEYLINEGQSKSEVEAEVAEAKKNVDDARSRIRGFFNDCTKSELDACLNKIRKTNSEVTRECENTSDGATINEKYDSLNSKLKMFDYQKALSSITDEIFKVYGTLKQCDEREQVPSPHP